MKLDTWHIVLIIVIVILLVWIFSSGNKSYETFNQTQIQQHNKQSDQTIPTLTKLVLDHMFYERLLMITYFTDKTNLYVAESNLVRNIQEINQYIKTYHPKLSILSDYIDKVFMTNIQPFFDLVYELYDSIESGNQVLQQQSIHKIDTITNAVANQFDRLLGTNIIQRYSEEYMKLYVPSIYAFLSGDQIKDTQYMQAMFKMGFDIVFGLFNHY
ncbi:putative ORFan [Tupanvirus deep ocean]|uniref:ORFan n=2 Tax=Tupanvirus TaxID=2094720 RepID=A0AC62A9G1_9VIRU|nr:putative ORFan [Tupanvirus deep ocean]QKU34417.1 putative ORFan [Tupanvirus deep ocean]